MYSRACQPQVSPRPDTLDKLGKDYKAMEEKAVRVEEEFESLRKDMTKILSPATRVLVCS